MIPPMTPPPRDTARLNPPGAGCLLLFCQEPTDRALAGWWPWNLPGIREDSVLKFLALQASEDRAHPGSWRALVRHGE